MPSAVTRIGRAVSALSPLLVAAPAAALPPASGSKCGSNWVNNEGAMACFVQGEEDVKNGVRHPHYVACTAAGEIFCCVDDNKGQNCEAVASGNRATLEQQLRALLAAQAAHLAVKDRPAGPQRQPAPAR